MNKKGSAIIVYLMIAIIFLVLAMEMADPLGETSGEAMNDTQLNCSTTTDDQTKAVCTQIDLYQPLYVGLIISLAGLLIGRIALG